MRQLTTNELAFVTGAGGCYTPPPPCKTKKGNNGFGNGADENLAAPGNSGSTGGGKEDSVGDHRGER